MGSHYTRTLTRHQLVVFLAIVAWGNGEAAKRLGLSKRTVSEIGRVLYRILDTHSRIETVVRLYPHIGHLMRIDPDPDDPDDYIEWWKAQIDRTVIAGIVASNSWERRAAPTDTNRPSVLK